MAETRVAGRFVLGRLAGAGGMGRVYPARDDLTGARVAVKLCAAAGEGYRARFLREAEALEQLSHPAIVGHVAHGEAEDGELYLAMEWLEGESLLERLRRAPLDAAETVKLGVRVAEGLEAAHRAGIVHRDLKPSNLFLVDKRVERVKIIDLGLASVDAAPPLTRTGDVVGSPGHAAPEQRRAAHGVDGRADVYALGCVLHHAVTGAPPGMAGPEAPAPIAAVIRSMMAEAAEERPASAAEAARLLGRLVVDETLAVGALSRTDTAVGDAPSTPAPSRSAASPPVADRYLLLGELGRGGMGVVHAALDLELGRKVALKVVHPERASAAARARLQREAQALALLKHPNVVTVYDLGFVGDDIFVAMELVEGGSLAAWLAETPRGWREIVTAFAAAGRGLAAAHEAGLVHRDFKPENVLFGKDGTVRVVDFGLARLAPGAVLEEAESGPEHLGANITRAGGLAGTPVYMSPEVLRGEPADARSDQFSFAVALTEALTGNLPFHGESLRELQEAVEGGVALDRRVAPGRVRAVVARAMRVEPRDRFPTMKEVVAELAGALEPRRGRRILIAAATLAVAGAAGGLWWRGLERARACGRAADAIDVAWTAGKREAARRAFAATTVPYAARAFEVTAARLDAYAQEWSRTTGAFCRQDRLDVATRGCLEERRQAVLVLGDLLTHADGAVVKNAERAASGLERIEDCGDARAEPRPMPVDPLLADRVADVRAGTARALTFARAGKPRAAYLLRAIVAQTARALGFAPAEAEALQALAVSQDDFDSVDVAERTHFEAYTYAVEGGLDSLAGTEASRLALSRKHLDPTDELLGPRWARLAEAHERRDGRDLTIVTVEGNLSLFHDNDLPEAIARMERVWAALERSPRILPEEVVVMHSNMSRLLGRRGDFAGARLHLARAAAIVFREMGPDHPNVGVILTNEGTLLAEQRRFAEALPLYQRALENARLNFGPNHARTYLWAANLAVTESQLGLGSVAERRIEEAASGMRALLAPEHPWLLSTERMRAVVLIERRRYEEARVILEQVLAVQEKQKAPPDATVLTLVMLGEVALAQGHPDAARTFALRAIELGKSLDPGHDDVRRGRELLAKLH